jgi:HSP20 family protein
MNALETVDVDQTIAQVEKLYRAVMGRDPGPIEGVYAPIPAEKDPVGHVTEQMDRLASLLERLQPRPPAPSWTPPLSVWESDKEMLVCMDLPGVDRESVAVELQGNVLTVSGELKSEETEQEQRTYHVRERRYGRFSRQVSLPAGIRGDQIQASLENGILTLHIPKAEEMKPRRIQITGGTGNPQIVSGEHRAA